MNAIKKDEMNEYYNYYNKHGSISGEYADDDDRIIMNNNDLSVNFAEDMSLYRGSSVATIEQSLNTSYAEQSEDLYVSRSSRDEKIEWDVFNEYPLDDSNDGKEKCYRTFSVAAKLIAYVVVFLVVLMGSVISKGTLLFMSSQIQMDKKTPYCQLPNSNPDNRYEAKSNPQEQAQWLWAIFFTFITPEVFTLGRSYRLILFKSIKKAKPSDFFIVCFFETLHTIGVALLLFVALPELDVVKGAMLTNCLCLVPAVLSLLTRNKQTTSRFSLTVFLDVISIFAQVTGLVMWPYFMRNQLYYGVWAIPLGIFLTSFGWWENYVDHNSPFKLIKYLGHVKLELQTSRYFVYAIVPWWKMLVFFACMLGFVSLTEVGKTGWDKFPILEYFLTLDSRTIEINTVNLTNRYLADTLYDGNFYTFKAGADTLAYTTQSETVAAVTNAALLTWTIQFLCTWTSYVFGKFACRICIQSFSYAFPINLTVPVLVTMLITFCGVKETNVCFMKDMLPRYLFWDCPEHATENIFTDGEATWIWIIWLFSQTWITMHIWLPKCDRLASTEKLFVVPMYSGIFVDQSLAMNRQKFEGEGVNTKELNASIPIQQEYETIECIADSAVKKQQITKSADQITNIIACATMWHETEEEMMQMFKSIMRMDADQCARRNAQKYLQMVDPDYYEFQTQIFFDDAFEVCDENWDESVVNCFVKSALKMIKEAAREIHQDTIEVRDPTVIPTPYGGRLVWTLPGKTEMTIHLKDKSKIRHRKRWSQVMYMYYLLGFRIMATNFEKNYKNTLAENTYLLALDGDIDFKPGAVGLLVDLMKKNKNLGASCGRIHPIGSGLMVWYQKFEYAIGHWLQKATEHMIGCVLCSPGCFSMFRASAIMDDNVMKKYTFTPREALHYVQYDQGEDRWLCTLLLQQGYRVEYSAASDAYTHAPEGFAEFYNQRRRWVPSTMANIIDLLGDSKHTIKVNDDISILYIIYQGMLMVGTILGPGTIFLMMVGSFVAAFGVALQTSFFFNAIPLTIFMIMCMVAKAKNQVICAQILTCFYALVMLAVLVGVFLQISSAGWDSPTTFLTLMLPLAMTTAALLHPLEISCLLWGWLYWLIIPSMYMLLMIYSYTNMNNVSWGTREVLQKKTKQELEEEQKQAEEAKNKSNDQSFVLNFFGKDKKDLDGGFTCSCANLCSILLCTYPKPPTDQIQLLAIQGSLDKIVSRLELIEKTVDHAMPGFNRRRSSTQPRNLQNRRISNVEEGNEDENASSGNETASIESEPKELKSKPNPLINPRWLKDKDFDHFPKRELSRNEIFFWQDLIKTYLFPIDEDKAEKARIMKELKELRNKVIFAFFMLNAVFIVIVLLLQLNRDTLYINWPLGATSNITWTDDTETIKVTMIYQHLQPIGLIFMVFFAVIIIIQFIGMLFHRFETLSHILASTIIECLNGEKDQSVEARNKQKDVDIIRDLQKGKREFLADNDFSDDSQPMNRATARRMTVHKIERAKKFKRQTSLDQVLRNRLFSVTPDRSGAPVLRRLSKRRETIMQIANRQLSVSAGSGGPPVSVRPSLQSTSHYQEGRSGSSAMLPTVPYQLHHRPSVHIQAGEMSEA